MNFQMFKLVLEKAEEPEIKLPISFSSVTQSCLTLGFGEGNGNPLQCSCLENPRDGGAWWAAISGVTQNRTWLKWRSSSSSLYKKKKGHKMSTGLQGQKILYTTLFMGKVCRKNPGFDKDKTDVMFGLTLYDFASFISLYVQVKV